MPKVATQTSTKAATRKAAEKPIKPAKEEKAKRAPTAYNVFMKDRLADYKLKHPDLNHKEAFTAVAALWKDAPENPNRGKEAAPKKKAAEGKENVASKPKSKTSRRKKAAASSEEENDEEASDD